MGTTDGTAGYACSECAGFGKLQSISEQRDYRDRLDRMVAAVFNEYGDGLTVEQTIGMAVNLLAAIDAHVAGRKP